MKYLLMLISIIVFAGGCKKNDHQVKYQADQAVAETSLQYLVNGQLQEVDFVFNSLTDQWTYQFTAEAGSIVYLLGSYRDAQSGLRLQIMIDGKVYKSAYNTSDTLKPLIVSGTIPFD